MLINVSNHPSNAWPEEERNAAKAQFGGFVDYPFPPVDPKASTEEVSHLASRCLDDILVLLQSYKKDLHNAVLCQGEFSLTYILTALLQQAGISVLAATTERNTTETYIDGIVKKESIFRFVQFREYAKL